MELDVDQERVVDGCRELETIECGDQLVALPGAGQHVKMDACHRVVLLPLGQRSSPRRVDAAHGRGRVKITSTVSCS